MAESLLVQDADGIRVLTVNRPEVRNAIDAATASAMAAALDELDARDDLRVGILTGAGAYFSAGMDLKAFGRGERPIVPGRGFAGLTERALRTPLIAAVEGPALAGGCEMALACDLVVAARDARFGIPEVKRGLVAAGGGLLRLPRKLPPTVAMELALTGNVIEAERAWHLGLVNRLAEPGQALAVATVFAYEIVANAPLAVQTSKRIVDESRDWPGTEAFDRQRPLSEAVIASADAKEGAAAFVEKRAPQWVGR